MKSIDISGFPCSPEGKTGWPWTESSKHLPELMPDGSEWPKISIVTPSYNQAQYLEETIRSVLLQGYPNLEYIIIDGGSTDCSMEIIKKYEPWLTYWVSERDRGQSHAINKGFESCTGQIMAWINSDDYYLPNAFYAVAREFHHSKWILGISHVVEEDGKLTLVVNPERPAKSEVDACFKNKASFDFIVSQPNHFWSKELIDEIGFLNEKYHYCMDRDWMLRALSAGHHPTLINTPLACQRYQPESKTMRYLWAFDIDKARIYKDLGFRGKLKYLPAMKLCRDHAAKGYRSYSDDLFSENKKIVSLFYVCLAWILSRKKVGGNYLSRVIRVIKK